MYCNFQIFIMDSINKKTQFKKKCISLEDKIEILNRLNNGEKLSSVANSLNVNKSTIQTIRKNENRIRQSVAEGHWISAKRVARVRDMDMIRMENAVMIWFEDCVDKNIPLSGFHIKQKALKIYKHIKEIENIENFSAEQPSKSFLASDGWLDNLKKRFSLHNIRLQGEQSSANAEAAHNFTKQLREIVDSEEYTADQIFNADEKHSI